MKLLIPLAVLLLLGLSSCAHYERYGLAKSRMQKLNSSGVSVYLVDAAHPLTRGWFLSEPVFEARSVKARITRMSEVETMEMSLIRDRYDARQSRNDILLFAKPQFAESLPDTTSIVIQDHQLEKIEVCELNHLRTYGAPLLGCTGMVFLLYLVTQGY
ncbi:MAG: hypothetical protein J0M29_20930 [Chitinophagales bacterium]|nr:hypothetical protein [Chitinophagales bacterium]